MVWSKAYFDIINPLGVTHKCNGKTDGRRDRRSDRHSNRKMCASLRLTAKKQHLASPDPKYLVWDRNKKQRLRKPLSKWEEKLLQDGHGRKSHVGTETRLAPTAPDQRALAMFETDRRPCMKSPNIYQTLKTSINYPVTLSSSR